MKKNKVLVKEDGWVSFCGMLKFMEDGKNSVSNFMTQKTNLEHH